MLSTTLIVSAMLLGFSGSLHCLGMCGPIMLSITSEKGPAGSPGLIVSYFFGKTLAYSSMGVLVGFLGYQLVLAGFQQGLSIGLGVLMVLFGLLTIFRPNIFHQNIFTQFMGKQLAPIMASFVGRKNVSSVAILGFLNGFLPCGLVYMALSAASATGQVLNATLFMFLFGLASIPGMLLLHLLAGSTKQQVRVGIQRLTPVFTLVIGALLIMRGLNLGIPFLSPELPQQVPHSGTIQAIGCH